MTKLTVTEFNKLTTAQMYAAYDDAFGMCHAARSAQADALADHESAQAQLRIFAAANKELTELVEQLKVHEPAFQAAEKARQIAAAPGGKADAEAKLQSLMAD